MSALAFSKLSAIGATGSAVAVLPAADKSQGVRLLDVFVFGPFLIATGLAGGVLGPLARAGLLALGAGTIAYNARNYFRTADALAMAQARGVRR